MSLGRKFRGLLPTKQTPLSLLDTPLWAQILRLAVARRLRPHHEHMSFCNQIMGGRAVVDIRWLPARQIYSCWFAVGPHVYADTKARLIDFASGIDDVLKLAENR